MFALLFSAEPNGLAAAARFEEEEEYRAFADLLGDGGFTEISPQASLLLVNGNNPGNQGRNHAHGI